MGVKEQLCIIQYVNIYTRKKEKKQHKQKKKMMSTATDYGGK